MPNRASFQLLHGQMNLDILNIMQSESVCLYACVSVSLCVTFLLVRVKKTGQLINFVDIFGGFLNVNR